MKPNELVLGGVNICQYASIPIQDNPVFQWIQLILAIVASLVLIAYRLWKWWKEAKKDGKIDKQEIKEGIDIIKDGLEDVKNTIDENTKKEEK